ncbi:MAG: PepSY domain-containing protein [Mycobacteriales bacterium]
MKMGKQVAVIGVATVAAAGIGLAGVAVAQGSNPSSANGAAEAGADAQDPSYTGSVRAPADNGTEQSDAAEAQALAGLASITPAQAVAAATAAVPGTAGAAALGNENGYVVYGVEVTAADGTVTDVKVDAGNGAVLARDADTETED